MSGLAGPICGMETGRTPVPSAPAWLLPLITATVYKRGGKPEIAMAEIRRMLLEKISARIEKDRAKADLLKESAPPQRI
jgi:hypothetical protein